MGPKLGILVGLNKQHHNYIAACRELGLAHELIEIFSPDWIEIVRRSDCAGFLARPPCNLQEHKNIYDERLYFLNKVLGRPIYPTWEELFIYENKRATLAWLEVHGYPHPRSQIFARKKDALAYLDSCQYPVVFKSNISASAGKVRIVRSKLWAKFLTHRLFGWVHPMVAHGDPGYRMFGITWPAYGMAQRHYAIIQQFERIRWEWRIIKIGDSYFGHQKLLKGLYASGSGRVGWVRPPDELLFLIKDVCDRGRFHSMAMDVFETEDGRFLINELQSIFGSYLESQMYVDGVPGRLRLRDGVFVFEEGVYNRHGSYLLRVEHFCELLEGKVPS